jgi:hypothetical protein
MTLANSSYNSPLVNKTKYPSWIHEDIKKFIKKSVDIPENI